MLQQNRTREFYAWYMVHDIINMTQFPLGILHDIILCHFPLGICLTSSVLLQQKLNNSVVEVLEEGLELGADGGLGAPLSWNHFLSIRRARVATSGSVDWSRTR